MQSDDERQLRYPQPSFELTCPVSLFRQARPFQVRVLDECPPTARQKDLGVHEAENESNDPPPKPLGELQTLPFHWTTRLLESAATHALGLEHDKDQSTVGLVGRADKTTCTGDQARPFQLETTPALPSEPARTPPPTMQNVGDKHETDCQWVLKGCSSWSGYARDPVALTITTASSVAMTQNVRVGHEIPDVLKPTLPSNAT
jgi:hypothetical protein